MLLLPYAIIVAHKMKYHPLATKLMIQILTEQEGERNLQSMISIFITVLHAITLEMNMFNMYILDVSYLP